MKKYVLLVFLVLILGCVKEYTFESTLDELNQIDTKYGTSLYEEHLNYNLPSMDIIKGVRKDIILMEVDIPDSGHKKAINELIKFRLLMLDAEDNYHKFLSYGKTGLVHDGFGCKEKPYILEAQDYWNKSLMAFRESVFTMDMMLTNYPETRIFIEPERPFYLNFNWTKEHLSNEYSLRTVNRLCPEYVEKQPLTGFEYPNWQS